MNKIIIKSDLLNIDDDGFELLKNGLYVYCPYVTMRKTRLSEGMYDEVGALILGTADQSMCEKLHFSFFQ